MICYRILTNHNGRRKEILNLVELFETERHIGGDGSGGMCLLSCATENRVGEIEPGGVRRFGKKFLQVVVMTFVDERNVKKCRAFSEYPVKCNPHNETIVAARTTRGNDPDRLLAAIGRYAVGSRSEATAWTDIAFDDDGNACFQCAI